MYHGIRLHPETFDLVPETLDLAYKVGSLLAMMYDDRASNTVGTIDSKLEPSPGSTAIEFLMLAPRNVIDEYILYMFGRQAFTAYECDR